LRGREVEVDAAWLAKWSRSSAKFPTDVPPEQQPPFEHALRTHPQFFTSSARLSD